MKTCWGYIHKFCLSCRHLSSQALTALSYLLYLYFFLSFISPLKSNDFSPCQCSFFSTCGCIIWNCTLSFFFFFFKAINKIFGRAIQLFLSIGSENSLFSSSRSSLLMCLSPVSPFLLSYLWNLWSLKINDFSFSILLVLHRLEPSTQGLTYTFALNPSRGPYAVSYTLAWGQIYSSVSSLHRDPQCSLCCCEHLCLCAGVSLSLMRDFTELVQLLWDMD